MSMLDNRASAMSRAQDLLPKDVDPTDLIIVADWLLTGKIDTAMAFADQRDRQYRAAHPDAVDLRSVQ